MKNIDEMYQLERFSKTDEEFDAFYENELKHKIEPLEKDRLKVVNETKNKAKFLIIPIIICIIVFIFLQDYIPFVGAATVILGIYLFKDVKRHKRELSKRIKDEVITDIILFLNENFQYEPKKFISRKRFSQSNIFKHTPNRYRGDDLIKGFVGSKLDDVKDFDKNPTKTDLQFSEVKADKVTKYRDKDGKKRERVDSIFEGLFFVADFNKDFEGVTIVVPKQGRWLSLRLGADDPRRLQEVELEDIDFMDKFTIRSTDQITARYILTPNFMNRMLEFTKRDDNATTEKPKSIKEALQMGLNAENEFSSHLSTTPYFSFKNGKMYFMLPTGKKHFEFNLFFSLNKRLMDAYFNDINLALRLVDELNLNLRIWNKK